MKTQAIVPMAGVGARFNAEIPKPLVFLKEKPICVYALERLAQSVLIDSIILVVHAQYMTEYRRVVEKYQLKKISEIIAGGETRRESVFYGLNVLKKDTEFVLIHDGARPLITQKIINESICLCQEAGAVIVAVPLKPTVKRVDGKDMVVEETLKREELWEVQTPQVFQKSMLIKAHKQHLNFPATDDAFLVEKMGNTVKVLQGNYHNIKITTPEDLIIAEALFNND